MSASPIRAAGCVVLARDETGRLLVLLIKDRQGVWTLPKGHLDDGEGEEQAAIREVLEETGVRCTIAERLDQVTYPVYRRGHWRDKQVTFFLASAAPEPTMPALAEGIQAAAWVPIDEAAKQIGYRQLRLMVQRLAHRLRKNTSDTSD